MLGGRKITATITGETLEGPVAKVCSQRGIWLPPAVKPAYRRTLGFGKGFYTHWGMHYSHQHKIPK